MSFIKIFVDTHGSIPSGRWKVIIDRYKSQVTSRLGDEAVTRIRAYLATQYMYLGNNGGSPQFNPVPIDAGYYQANVRSYRYSPDLALVTDSNVPYGPWLEGISDANWIIWPHRRNPPPRRFPGYFAFKKVATQLAVDSEAIAQEELPRYIGELNA